MKRPRPNARDAAERRALLDALKQAMIDAVNGAPPGARPITIGDKMREAVRDLGE